MIGRIGAGSAIYSLNKNDWTGSEDSSYTSQGLPHGFYTRFIGVQKFLVLLHMDIRAALVCIKNNCTYPNKYCSQEHKVPGYFVVASFYSVALFGLNLDYIEDYAARVKIGFKRFLHEKSFHNTTA